MTLPLREGSLPRSPRAASHALHRLAIAVAFDVTPRCDLDLTIAALHRHQVRRILREGFLDVGDEVREGHAEAEEPLHGPRHSELRVLARRLREPARVAPLPGVGPRLMLPHAVRADAAAGEAAGAAVGGAALHAAVALPRLVGHLEDALVLGVADAAPDGASARLSGADPGDRPLALVHLRDLLDVRVRKPKPVAELDGGLAADGPTAHEFQGLLAALLREEVVAVVHDGVRVVVGLVLSRVRPLFLRRPDISRVLVRVDLEVDLLARPDVLPEHLDVGVPVRARLLVGHADGVAELVHGHADTVAAHRVELQRRDRLLQHAHVGVAAGALL